MKKIFLAAVMAISVMGFGSLANATLISVDNPFYTQSWDQLFNESSVGPFDRMEVFMTSAGDSFGNPAMRNFSDSTWTSSLVRPDYAIATGSDVSSLFFSIHFDEEQLNPLDFIFLAWDGSTLIEADNASWTGSNWNISPYSGNVNGLDRSAPPVPEPGTVFLLGAGLVGLGLFRRKMKR